MKAKIVTKDTTIELEGTADELKPFIDKELGRNQVQVTIKPTSPTDLGKLLDEMSKQKVAGAPYWPSPPTPTCPDIASQLPWITYTNDLCPVTGGQHEYPTIWMSVSPPSCLSCGRGSGLMSTTTVSCKPPVVKVNNDTLPFISGFTVIDSEPQSSKAS